jgi:hypothetical protein
VRYTIIALTEGASREFFADDDEEGFKFAQEFAGNAASGWIAKHTWDWNAQDEATAESLYYVVRSDESPTPICTFSIPPDPPCSASGQHAWVIESGASDNAVCERCGMIRHTDMAPSAPIKTYVYKR